LLSALSALISHHFENEPMQFSRFIVNPIPLPHMAMHGILDSQTGEEGKQ